MKIFFFALCVMTSFLCSLWAQDFEFDKDKGKAIPNYIGQLKLVKGRVLKTVNGKTAPLKVGDRFYKNDTLTTNDKSIAKILIVDDTTLTIGPNSELNFAEFKFIDKTDRQIVYNLIKGQVNGMVKTKAKEGDIVFKTKYTSMGVRGTQILVNHQTIKNLEVSEFALLSGSAVVTDEKNVKHELTKHQRLVLVHNELSNEMANKRDELSQDEKQLLKSDDELMPFFQPEGLTPESDLYTFFNNPLNKEEKLVNSEATEKRPVQKKPWRENLKKLNEQLKENQESKKSR